MASRRRIAPLCILLTAATIVGLPSIARADEYARLKGVWTCEEAGTRSTLEFLSSSQLSYNGEITTYQLIPNAILVQEEYEAVPYYYRFQDDALVFFSPDGSVSQCRKAARQAAPSPSPGQVVGTARPGALVPGPNWPRYERPAGRVSEDHPSPQALLYKFAGRWDHVTTNTLTNLYLKPDGTYEGRFEAGYSGQFQDQGGYQTGNWGTAGQEQDHGHWMIEGSLRQGSLTLIDPSGNRAVYRYEVHVKGGEAYWGEYFFNGELYSVKYVYR
jgi:hypothetical protein